MKKFTIALSVLSLFLVLSGQVFAATVAEATALYSSELQSLGMTKESADSKAQEDVGAVVSSMQASQTDISFQFDTLKDRVDKLLKSDKRRDAAKEAIENAEADDGSKKAFLDMKADTKLFVQESIGGTPPSVSASDDFTLAEEQVQSDLSQINRILIGPTQPGAVPAGDLVSDFIPQIIRQLFRFAWLAVLVSLTASGVMLVMAHDDDAKLTKAKSMLYYTLIGSAFVSLAFALVKAVTDIDFFRFLPL